MQPLANMGKLPPIRSDNSLRRLQTEILVEISAHLMAISTQHKSSYQGTSQA